tara:strand:+ start:1845 stop:1988 length:144 start_codon:yes stop_codon:yes gene_type:complete
MGDFISNKKIISLEWDSSFRHGQKGGYCGKKRVHEHQASLRSFKQFI